MPASAITGLTFIPEEDAPLGALVVVQEKNKRQIPSNGSMENFNNFMVVEYFLFKFFSITRGKISKNFVFKANNYM